MFVFHFKR